jgi:FtsP/CotA-like multicopper oxidase with cupredoxin domain
MRIKLSIIVLFLALSVSAQKIVRYDLYVRDTIVTFGDKPKRAIAVNGQIPMPTLTFTEGDIAEIYVHNELKESTSLHWHGLMLPNIHFPSFNTVHIGITVIRDYKNKSECMAVL